MPYFHNPGNPTDDEWGVYCPHGEKIIEADRGPTGNDVPIGRPVDPWPCKKPNCTLEAFEEVDAEAEAEYMDSMRPGMWE